MVKKRYTKKKKTLFSSDPNSLPYDKYRVEWVDCVSDSGWADEKQFKNMKLSNPINEVGCFLKIKFLLKFLLHMTKKKMVLIHMEIVL